jgi:hypothetical protein
MQVIWMVLITLGLALSGILGLALVAHARPEPGGRDSTAKRELHRSFPVSVAVVAAPAS